MDEKLYMDLIDTLNEAKEAGGHEVKTKEFEFSNDTITCGIIMAGVDDIQMRVNGKTLIYTDGVYCNIPTAVVNGMSLTEIEEDGGYYVPEGISNDLKETIDASVAEFYKFIMAK